VCLLTGAGGTLGSAFCRLQASRYDIVAVCRRRAPDAVSQHERYVDPLDPEAALAENENAVFTVFADLERPGEPERVVDLALARFGRVDLLVNNAAYVRQHPPGLTDPGVLTDLDRHFTLNVGVPLRLATVLADRFWRHRDVANRAANRNIVNVSSLSGSRVYQGIGQGVYAASKAALNQLTRHLAADFTAVGVRVNAVAPTSFPALVPTERVVAAITRLDRESVTGKILVVDEPANKPLRRAGGVPT
jgi:NAD(P)-dependent dehydrogenase (short-subunit alcohol dehydrogenase family)